ncbi:MAG: hypothetical protein IJM37_02135 [Lachnospiraceae bacterium]|nr:hypothetical protein [Lachnospiraceae bacterium]
MKSGLWTTNENVDEGLLRELQKGIDDIEAGRVYTLDEAFKIINERIARVSEDANRKAI